VAQGYGTESDLETTEDRGCLPGADPEKVRPRAIERGRPQLGTLGSGNHFLEIEVVEEIFDPEAARAFGLEMGQVAVMIHSGSRGLGYQVCDDFLARLVKHVRTLDLNLPDRQLACAYIRSREGGDYLAAMACAANYAWANRQMLMHWTRETFEKTLKKSPRELGMRLLYDVCHNIAKIETFQVEGRERTLCVHRKGATRAFPAGHAALPDRYRAVGQPVLTPGDMGAGSYVLAGTEKAMAETFGSSCHGAGRVMSRTQAVKSSRGRAVARELAERGILVMASGKETLREEIPEAYKDWRLLWMWSIGRGSPAGWPACEPSAASRADGGGRDPGTAYAAGASRGEGGLGRSRPRRIGSIPARPPGRHFFLFSSNSFFMSSSYFWMMMYTA
jgi:tRNA-splicing ligase RtcB